MNSGQMIWLLMGGGVLFWLFYMMTFRTDDFMRLWEANQKAKNETFQQVGRAGKAVMPLLGLFLGKRR